MDTAVYFESNYYYTQCTISVIAVDGYRSVVVRREIILYTSREHARLLYTSYINFDIKRNLDGFQN